MAKSAEEVGHRLEEDKVAGLKTDRRVAGLKTKRRTPLSPNALTVLESRYFARDDDGKILEDATALFGRIAHHISLAENNYGGNALKQPEVEEQFYELLSSLDFLPNSPTIGNAGRPLGQLSACFVIPVPDSIIGIFDAVKQSALIHKTGGGTGFSFSNLRPEGDVVQTTQGIASGPVSFMKVFDSATAAIKQGGTRRGANMAVLSSSHPDVEQFVDAKNDMKTLTNFNISVGVSDAFMKAVKDDTDYELIHPVTKKVVGKKSARSLFKKMTANAWKNGDPGMLFLDRANNSRSNPVPGFGPIEATNPCGEQYLYSNDSCNLGSINLGRHVEFLNPVDEPDLMGVNWEKLAATTKLSTRFLDNVVDMNKYPLPEIEETSRALRRIGLGVMGWADMLFQLRIPYDSPEALTLAKTVMDFVQLTADQASEDLAGERGVFPVWTESIYGPAGQGYEHSEGIRKFRNSTRTTVAPTGTLSIIADCIGGIEPAFSLAFTRKHYLDKKDANKLVEMVEVNKYFKAAGEIEGWYSEELVKKLVQGASIRDQEVPDWVKRVFVSAQDVSPEYHVKMQAAFQSSVDNSLSKTINMPHSATVEDVANAYRMAYDLGCKGITIYRDGSRDTQILNFEKPATNGNGNGHSNGTPAAELKTIAVAKPTRKRLPNDRKASVHKFTIDDFEGYVTVGEFEENGQPGEVFFTVSKEGSMIGGLMDTIGVLMSLLLQHGVPLKTFTGKLKGSRFEPHGLTGNVKIRNTTSIADYIARYLELKFLETSPQPSHSEGSELVPLKARSGAGCPQCGGMMYRSEGCETCMHCSYSKCG